MDNVEERFFSGIRGQEGKAKQGCQDCKSGPRHPSERTGPDIGIQQLVVNTGG